MGKKVVLSICLTIAALIVVVDALIFARVLREPIEFITILGFSHSLAHWLGWIGGLYIVVTIPIYQIVKYKAPKHWKVAINTHMVGNMLAALLVSAHFSLMVTKPSIYRDFGVGLVLYVLALLLALTGLVFYSGAIKKHVRQTRLLHLLFSFGLYSTIMIHVILILF